MFIFIYIYNYICIYNHTIIYLCACMLVSKAKFNNARYIIFYFCTLFQNMTLNYDTSGVGQNGVAASHMLPAATLTQYSRHYGQALPGYHSVPGTPWVAPYLVQTAPPHMQQVDVSFCIFRSFNFRYFARQ